LLALSTLHNFVVVQEGVVHDGDKHIQKKDAFTEDQEEEQRINKFSHWIVKFVFSCGIVLVCNKST
jgi:hypothetical protein